MDRSEGRAYAELLATRKKERVESKARVADQLIAARALLASVSAETSTLWPLG